MNRYFIDLLISILIDTLTRLLGALQSLTSPPLAGANGVTYHPQILVELQNLRNRRQSVAYWQGACHG